MEALIVLDKFYKSYSQCLTYRDRGYVERVRLEQETTLLMEFSTSFKRPAKFKFEWTVNPVEAPLCKAVASRSSGASANDLLCEAIQSVDYTSMGVAQLIPPLWTDAGCTHIHPKNLQNALLLQSELVLEEECFKLQATFLKPDDILLWLSVNDGTLRQYSLSRTSRFTKDKIVVTYLSVDINAESPGLHV